MWVSVLDRLLRHLIRRGELTIRFPDGETRRYGAPGDRQISVRLESADMVRRLVLTPEMALGEGYMNGDFTIEDDDLYGFLSLVIDNNARNGMPAWRQPMIWARRLGRYLRQFNPIGRAQRNVAHHYDLSAELYDLFLDEDKQYSCAYFRDPDMSLDAAQAAKKAHIADKLLIQPGMRVLDIGCGWGGMGLTLARDYGAQVVGVTLSKEQHEIARRRAEEAGLADKVDFRLQDYREVEGTFDRIVSVGMFEHVGVPHYNEYFRTIRRLLRPDGVALIHHIGRSGPPGTTSPWIMKYIFPGGYCPAMSEVLRPVQKSGLVTTDVEVWRLHYAETLRHWHDRFMARQEEARALFDDRFCRMWRFYLIASELTFRLAGQVVFQFQLTRDQAAVPLTRDYLYTNRPHPEREAAE